MKPTVLVVSPEPPYPLHGGGAYRIASLVHYFARFAEVDLILFSESGRPSLAPAGLIRSQQLIPLPTHGRGLMERYVRNAKRALRGVPPLIDRLAGFERQLSAAIAGRRYDIGIVEHFWLAPYLPQVQAACTHTLLDLHNVESVLHARCAEVDPSLVAAGHRRFATSSRALEAKLLPGFSLVLTTSESDSRTVHKLAPAARTTTYPNSLPSTPPQHTVAEPNTLVFSGNFEYHPNQDAVQYFISEIWPPLRKLFPALRLLLVGRGDEFIRHFIPPASGIETTGPVEDASAEIARAALVIAPLRAGSGTRIKILEAWRAGRPVVATPLAAEGLDAIDGTNIALASTSVQFSEAVSNLLTHPARAAAIATAGRGTFDHKYTWQCAWNSLAPVLEQLGIAASGGYTE